MSATEHVAGRAGIISNLTESFLKDHAREVDTIKECIEKNDAVTLYRTYSFLHKRLTNYAMLMRLTRKDVDSDIGICVVRLALDKIGC